MMISSSAAIIALDGTENEAIVEVSGAGQNVTVYGVNWPTDRGAIHVLQADGIILAVVEPPQKNWTRIIHLDEVDRATIRAVVLEEPHIPKPKPIRIEANRSSSWTMADDW